MNTTSTSAALAGRPSWLAGAIDNQSAAALFAAATVGFGTNLAIQLVNLGLHARGASTALIGLSTMAQAVGIVPAALLAPCAMRRLGPRRTMQLGAILAAVTMASFAHATGYLAVTALRIAYAIGLALVFSCAEFVVLSQSSDRQCGQAAGLYATVVGLGMALGPAWIAIVGSSSAVAYYSGASLCLACMPASRAFEDVHVPAAAHSAPTPVFTLAPLGFAAAFVFGFIDNGPVSLLPIAGLTHGWSSAQSVLLVTAVTLGAIACQWPVGRAVDRFGTGLVFRVGLLGAALIVVMLPFIWSSPALLVLAVIGLGAVLEGFYTVGLADIGRQVPSGQLAGANALFVAMCGTGEIVGPALTGFAFEVFK